MKKHFRFAVLLAVFVLLAGCGRQAETPEESSAGTGSGSVENLPVTVSFGGNAVEGVYTGACPEFLPDGKGEFRNDEGCTASGEFSSGKFLQGSVQNLPCTITVGSYEVTGFYSGEFSQGMPEGNGSFVSPADWSELDYSGGFSAGAFSGEGTLFSRYAEFPLDGGPVRGEYRGSVLNGLPEGEGDFRGMAADGTPFTYSGSWHEGKPEGQGCLEFDSPLYFKREGNFTAGRFTPDAWELLDALGTVEPLFSLSESKRAYLAQYPELLDDSRKVEDILTSEYRTLRDPALRYEEYIKQPGDFEEGWFFVFNYTVTDMWEVDTLAEGVSVTRIRAVNGFCAQPVECYLFGEAERPENIRVFSAYGIPLGSVTYTNATGEPVSAMAILLGAVTFY